VVGINVVLHPWWARDSESEAAHGDHAERPWNSHIGHRAVNPDAFVGSIERRTRIDAVSARLERAVGPLVERPKLRDLLTGRWLGHPAHPMLVFVPLSCWFGAGILEVVAGRRAARHVRRLTAIGVVASVPAAASGSADWLDTGGAEQRVGTVHASLNGIAATAFAASWWARRSGRLGRGRIWSLVGLAAASVSGYLGGHLSYRRGVGIDTTAFQSGPTEWQAVADLGDLPQGKAVGVDVDGVVLLLVRRNAADVDALEARCTHRGGPLHEGEVDHWCVTCPWHGSRFVLDDGSIERGPASAPQPAYETRTRGRTVEVRRTEHGSLRRTPVRGPVTE
jgi:nitrite reductase/ring-hydroxylating ferredoxin subunit/uncharacterized membrane protein